MEFYTRLQDTDGKLILSRADVKSNFQDLKDLIKKGFGNGVSKSKLQQFFRKAHYQKLWNMHFLDSTNPYFDLLKNHLNAKSDKEVRCL